MIKNKRVIIFDLDGTLIDSMGIWTKVDKELIDRIRNIELDNTDITMQRAIKLKEYSSCENPYLEYCKFLKEKYKSNLTDEEVYNLRYKISNNYLEEVIDYKPNAQKVLEFLKEKGYILAIASTTAKKAIEKYKYKNKNIINKANFDDIFSLIYTQEDVSESKPSPEVHYKIMKELNVKPEECLVVEDSLVGVESACNAGIEVANIYDKHSDSDREEIEKLAQYRFSDFNEMLEYMNEELGEKT